MRRALILSWLTVGCSLLEGVAAVLAGLGAGSTALVGFGADSFVESLSGIVMVWRFAGSPAHARGRERRAVPLVGWSFLVFGGYVAFDALRRLASGIRPRPTVFGVAVPVLSLLVMPALYLAKRRTARRLHSRSLAADSKQTLACMAMSAGVLIGFALGRALGLWQADPLIAVIIAILLWREGLETLREGTLRGC